MYDDADDHNSQNNAGHGELSVTVDGEHYELDTEYDLNKDGHNDTALVVTDDGHQVAFTDADQDGDADVAVEMDDKGNVIGAARYDEGKGEWVPVDPKSGNPTGADTHSSSSGSGSSSSSSGSTHSSGSDSGSGRASGEIMVDVPEESQDMSAGAATVDMNHDGKNDTAVVKSDDGDTFAFTDTNNDGKADQMTVIETDGTVTISQHTGEDEWTAVEKGHLDSSGKYVPDNQKS